MTKSSDCRFCNLTEKVLKENDYAQALLSNPHKVPGHILVMSKRHVEKPWELTDAELKDIFDLIFFIEQRLIGQLGDGMDIRQSYRPFVPGGKLKVNHVLFHLIPRSSDDYIYKVSEQYEDGLFAELDDMERDAVAKLLK